MSDQSKLGIGQIINSPQFKDAIHVAVAPVVAGEQLHPGDHVGFLKDGTAAEMGRLSIGIVDPFLKDRYIEKGQQFWLFLYPGSITSLRHDWSHPAFQEATGPSMAQEKAPDKSASEEWMMRWALKHMSSSYFDDNPISDEQAYAWALEAGRNHNVGPYEDARDHIDNEWWGHWENVTGEKGDRDQYFSCAC